jgi:DNA-directed RNA polymerase specialized sigma24 family protein
MADALGCARGTVKSRLARALARLRDVMTPAPPAEDRVELGGMADA